MKRDELVDAIRLQTDLDEQDVPLGTATLFLTEAFYRTAALSRRWKLYEADWSYTIAEDAESLTLDSDIGEIRSVVVTDSNTRLIYADHDLVKETASQYAASSPLFFSLWAGEMYIWPTVDADTAIGVSGYRKADIAWLSDPALEADLDPRLHIPLFHYAVSLAYAQQEDPELEMQYLQRWQVQVNEFKDDILKPHMYAPIVLNGGMDQY